MLNGFLLFAAFAGAFSPQSPNLLRQRPVVNPEAEEERMSDPPAPHRLHLTSPPARPPFGPLTSVQVNVNSLGQNIVGDAANEPSISVDPTNHNNIAIAWRQFDSVTSNFRQSGYAYSTDGGKTFTFPGVLESGVFRSDPVLAAGASGEVFYLSLLQTFYDTLWRSGNWGQSYTTVAAAEGGDKQWFTVDRTNSVGRGNIYQTWSIAGNNYGGAQYTRSTDGGLTWMSPIFIPNQPFWGTLDVGPNGECYLCGTDQSGNLWFVRSSNAKNAAVTPTFDLTTKVAMGGTVQSGQTVNPGGLSGQVWIAADKSGGPTNGNIYMLASLGRNTNNPCDVMFVRSTDGGQTFSAPVRVNDDPVDGKHYHWFGTLAVAPNGRLDAVWNDTRNDLTGKTSELFYSYSLDGGLTWAANKQISASFDETIGYPNQNKIGDYMGMVSDNTGADVAYSATFNGEEDVWFVRIPAVNVLPPDGYSLFRGVLVSGDVSSMQYADGTSLVVRNGLTTTPSEAPIQVITTAHSAVVTPTAFNLTVVAGASTAGLTQTIALFNYATGAFVPVDTRAATQTKQTVNVSASGSLGNFVNQATGEVKARISYIQTGLTTGASWQGQVDQVQWTIAP